jgi:hypothetical protein
MQLVRLLPLHNGCFVELKTLRHDCILRLVQHVAYLILLIGKAYTEPLYQPLLINYSEVREVLLHYRHEIAVDLTVP